MDWGGSFSLGAIAGAAAKAATDYFFKRQGEKNESRRKAVRDEIANASKRVDACLELAVRYYTGSQQERQPLSHDLRHQIRSLGMSFNHLNGGLSSLRLDPLPAALLVRFRQATTSQLDILDSPRLTLHDRQVLDIYTTAYDLQKAMNQLRYNEVV